MLRSGCKERKKKEEKKGVQAPLNGKRGGDTKKLRCRTPGERRPGGKAAFRADTEGEKRKEKLSNEKKMEIHGQMLLRNPGRKVRPGPQTWGKERQTAPP